MKEEQLIRRVIELRQAEIRHEHDPEDADDCRSDGFMEGFKTALEWVLEKWDGTCPVCWKEVENITTHVCYSDEEGECYACGYKGKEIWKHCQECKEPRELM